MLPAKDISRYQGAWQDTGEPIVLIKMSGGDAGLYMDPNASANYRGAIAAGKAVGGYHFIGWTMGASQEASWFWRAMSPIAENDVLALDVENGTVAVPANAPEYVLEMINYFETQGVQGGLVYMNLATLNAYDWSAVLAKWGLWLADWAVSPQDNIPTHYAYVMQQYADGPNYDHDEWFGTIEQFKAYGYHAAQPVPQSVPEPIPAPVPAPDPTPPVVQTPDPTPAETPPQDPTPPATTEPPVEPPAVPSTDPTPTPVPTPVVVTTPSNKWKVGVAAIVAAIATVVGLIINWLSK